MAYYETFLFVMRPGHEVVSADFAQYRAERPYNLRLMQDWTRVTGITER